MILRYRRRDGTQVEFELGERPITIGRGPEADLVILDEKASRLHCGIRLWGEDFVLMDLHSRNGTFVNDQRVEVTRLNRDDRIRIGACEFAFAQDGKADGGHTLLMEVQDEMAKGKGYSTLLREIVEDASLPVAEEVADEASAAHAEVVEEVEPGPHPAPAEEGSEATRPRTVRMKVRAPNPASSGSPPGAEPGAAPRPVKVESHAEPPPGEPPGPKREGAFKFRVPAKTVVMQKGKPQTPPTAVVEKTEAPKKTVQYRLRVPPKPGDGK